MSEFAEIEEKFKLMVRELGALNDGLAITNDQLKEIASDLGVTDRAWNYFQQKALQNASLVQKQFEYKNYRETIIAAENVLLLNPFLAGVRGWIAKSLLMLGLTEDENIFFPQALNAANRTLKIEPADRLALEVLATLNSKNRVKLSANSHTKRNLILAGGIVLVFTVLLIFLLFSKTSSGQVELAEQNITAAEMQLYSAFEKQEALEPKIRSLLTPASTVQDSTDALQLTHLKQLLSESVELKERYELNLKLTTLLSAVIYRKSLEQPSDLLNDLRVLLEGAENRIKVERKNYNDAITAYNLVAENSKKTKL
jgi:hypothetical protein